MSVRQFLKRFGNLARRFNKDHRGNMAVTFALTLIPVMGAVGAAVDYSHANSVKTALQAAADSTALMLSKIAATTNSSAPHNSAARAPVK